MSTTAYIYPNETTQRLNQERAIHLREMAQFTVQNAAVLPEMRTSSNGLSGHYFDYMALGNFKAQIELSVSVLFQGIEKYEDVTYYVRYGGRVVHVSRKFGDMMFSLVYVWRDEKEGETETPSEIVETALLNAWKNIVS